jgi:hypothetical protein
MLSKNIAIAMDKSNGYEGIATRFIEARGQTVNGLRIPILVKH